MSRTKRVITVVDDEGDSVFQSVGPPRTIVGFEPGFELQEIWRLDRPPVDPTEGYDPASYELEPVRGGVVFRTFTIPPDHEVLPLLDELRALLGPNADISLKPETYGRHQTSTIDFVTVISGEINLRLDNDREVHLKPGDCVVQRGTRHAWRNRGATPCVMSAVLLGTRGMP